MATRNKCRHRDSSPSLRPSSPEVIGDAPNASSSTASAPTKQEHFAARWKVGERTDKTILGTFFLVLFNALLTIDSIDLQAENWTSGVYNHFDPPKIVYYDGGQVKYLFQCKRNPSKTVTRRREDDSTSNLVRHVDGCEVMDTPQTRAMAAFAHGSMYSESNHRLKVALWVACRNRPFAIVEDPELLDIFQNLNNKAITPSAITVSHYAKEIFKLSRVKVSEMLQNYPGKLHLCIDGWTSPQVISFLGATVHYISDSQLKSIILDFIGASKAHTGKYLAAWIAECLHEYGIQGKILGLVADNASNNNVLVEELTYLLPRYDGPKTRVRCFAHILNLIVKAILSQFNKKTKASTDGDHEDADLALLSALEDGETGDEEPDELDDDDELSPDVTASDDLVIEDIGNELDEDNRVPALTRADINLGRFSISKLRNLANKIVHSPTIRADLATACVRSKQQLLLMVRDVSTRWNSTAALIQHALKLCDPLKMLVVMAEHNEPGRGVRLQRFQLKDEEWELLGQLWPLLDVFLTATKKILSNRTPLIHQVIPIFNIITSVLDRFIDNENNLPAVCAAALRGLKITNKYYSLTDESRVLRITIMMHPQYKTSYFVRASWPREWIEEAEQLAREAWEEYKPLSTVAAPPTNTNADASTSSHYFDALNDHSIVVDALEEWLSSAPVITNVDPITWWTGMATAGHALARMALDYLSIPATSTDVERAFSKGGLTVSKMRHSLSEESTRASTVLGSWCDVPGLVPLDEIITVFKDKRSQTGKGKGKVVEVIDIDMDGQSSS